MWSRKSHKLGPLTKITSNKGKFTGTEVKQDAFDKIKRIMSRTNLLTYPDSNEKFKIQNDSSAFQLDAVIRQKGKTIAFHSRELNDTQQRYTLTDR